MRPCRFHRFAGIAAGISGSGSASSRSLPDCSRSRVFLCRRGALEAAVRPFPADLCAFVFERFYKVDAARSNGGGGSGLGLSISKAIVERHGGQIVVTSRPGRTVFTIRLPLTAVASSVGSGLSRIDPKSD
ncbi:MAG: ATP-binding protein [Acidobacteriota bacterium]